MAAGLGFKTFTTGEVLTAADTNGYLMQGVLVFADAAARAAAITSPQEGQVTYLKDTNSTEYYSGSAYVAVGAAGGGLTLISTTSLTGASVTLSSIPQTYKSLYLVVSGVTNATADGVFAINPNSTGNCTYVAIRSVDANAVFNSNDFRVTADTNMLRTDANNIFAVTIDNYTSAATYKSFSWTGFYVTTGPANIAINGGGGFKSNTAISSINIKNYGGDLSTGTVLLYGVS
jgi:hypothetical protein